MKLGLTTAILTVILASSSFTAVAKVYPVPPHVQCRPPSCDGNTGYICNWYPKWYRFNPPGCEAEICLPSVKCGAPSGDPAEPLVGRNIGEPCDHYYECDPNGGNYPHGITCLNHVCSDAADCWKDSTMCK